MQSTARKFLPNFDKPVTFAKCHSTQLTQTDVLNRHTKLGPPAVINYPWHLASSEVLHVYSEMKVWKLCCWYNGDVMEDDTVMLCW